MVEPVGCEVNFETLPPLAGCVWVARPAASCRNLHSCGQETQGPRAFLAKSHSRGRGFDSLGSTHDSAPLAPLPLRIFASSRGGPQIGCPYWPPARVAARLRGRRRRGGAPRASASSVGCNGQTRCGSGDRRRPSPRAPGRRRSRGWSRRCAACCERRSRRACDRREAGLRARGRPEPLEVPNASVANRGRRACRTGGPVKHVAAVQPAHRVERRDELAGPAHTEASEIGRTKVFALRAHQPSAPARTTIPSPFRNDGNHLQGSARRETRLGGAAPRDRRAVGSRSRVVPSTHPRGRKHAHAV